MAERIDISKLEKAEVLKALYDVARTQGMGFVDYGKGDMGIEEARKLIEESKAWTGLPLYFDYVKGRVLKVRLEKDDFDPWLYDRDNGLGAAKKAIDEIR